MDLSDLMVLAGVAVLVVLGALAAMGLAMTLVHYRESAALAHDTFTPGRPCRLALPPGAAMDVMVRIGTTSSRGSSVGITAIVEIDRAPTRTRFAVGLSATAPRPEGLPFQETDGASYLFVKSGETTTRTKFVTRVPPGEAGWVSVDLAHSHADLGYCAAFVKPAR